MTSKARVLIVGAGIGGLAASIAFAQSGWSVAVAEKRTTFDEPGVGLGQPANALRVYRELGVFDQIAEAGFAFDRLRIFDHHRTLITDHAFRMGDDATPAFVALSRARLHDILLSAALAAGVDIRVGTRATILAEEANSVRVDCGGHLESFELVAGFDGIGSSVRRYLFGERWQPASTGFGAWRVEAARPPEVDAMEFIQGIGGKTGVIPLSDDRMYLFHIGPEADGLKVPPGGAADEFRRRFDGYGGYVADIASALTTKSQVVYSPLNELLVPRPWHRRRIVLGGDAAHVVPPHLTQGAAMAVEDAYVLAQCLPASDAIDPSALESALRRYETLRYPRAAFVASFAGWWMRTEQSVRSADQLRAISSDWRANMSDRIGASDAILDERPI